MSEELILIHSVGSLPGIPGEHAPGLYLVDYEARTIRPAVDAASPEDVPTQEEPSPAGDPEVPAETKPEEPAPPQDAAMPEVVAVPDLPLTKGA